MISWVPGSQEEPIFNWNFCFYCFGVVIALVLLLLSFDKSTNTNTIQAFGIVFHYNIKRVVHLC